MVQFGGRIVVGNGLTKFFVPFEFGPQQVDVVVDTPNFVGAGSHDQFLRIAEARGEELFVGTVEGEAPDFPALRSFDRFVGRIGLVADVGVNAILVDEERAPHVATPGAGGKVFGTQNGDVLVGLAVAIRVACF